MHVCIKCSGYLYIFCILILCLCTVGSTTRRHIWRWRDSDSYKNRWLLDFVSISFPLFGFVLNVPVSNHRSISTKFNDNICICLTPKRHVYSTESLQPADENLETVLSVPLFCERHCSLPTHSPPWDGKIRGQAAFLLRLLFMGEQLSKAVKGS
jgi:hypothetical protein